MESLKGSNVVVLTNLKAKNLKGFLSHGMVSIFIIFILGNVLKNRRR